MFFKRVRQFGRAMGNAHRLRVIIGVFLKYGYEDLVRQLPLSGFWRWLPVKRVPSDPEMPGALSRPERLRMAFEELGPAFVKLGQLMAGRTRMLPRAYIDELEKLQDQVKPLSFAEVEQVLDREMGARRHDLFSAIDPVCVGSASIAQVHRARLKDGREVVLKVQRPGIEPIIRADLEIMGRLAHLLERHIDGWQLHRPTAIVAEFARRMEAELDFRAEAASMERFERQFMGLPGVRVPKVFRECSTRRLIVMEYIEGIPASQVEALVAAGQDPVQLSHRLFDLTLRQVFVHGFFHADPHPGNLRIQPNGDICFLDFGMTGFLVRDLRETLGALLGAVAAQDEQAATQALLKLAGAELDPDRPGLEADVAEFIYRHFSSTTQELIFTQLLKQLFELTARHELTLPPEVFTVVKALAQIENVVRSLAPREDLLEQSKPFVKELRSEYLKPQRLVRELFKFSGESLEALRSMPLEFKRIAAQLRGGKSKVTFQVEGLAPLNETLERVTNRLAFAIVLGATMLASSLVIHANVEPTWHGISVFGLVGYLFSGVMGMGLLIAILRHGRI